MSEPIFKSIFGSTWSDLPPVMHTHYGNCPHSNDVTVVKGTVDVECRPALKWLAPVMKCLGQIPLVQEQAVPTTVEFRSDPQSEAFHMVRRFAFKGGDYVFHSRMVPIKDNELLEVMPFGLAWHLSYSWDGEKVVLSHRGYALNFRYFCLPLPLTMLIGKGYAEGCSRGLMYIFYSR